MGEVATYYRQAGREKETAIFLEQDEAHCSALCGRDTS